MAGRAAAVHVRAGELRLDVQAGVQPNDRWFDMGFEFQPADRRCGMALRVQTNDEEGAMAIPVFRFELFS